MQPGNGAFDDPAGDPQTTPMRHASPRQNGQDATRPQFSAVTIRVVGPIALNAFGAATRPADRAAHRRDGIQQRQQLGNVVAVGPRQRHSQWNAARIRHDVMFAAGPAFIGRIGPRLGPPFSARTLELSTIARDQSIRSAPRKRASSTACNCCHTPARCQARSRRQQVMPEPQPISWGKSSQAIPVLSTNRMPVSVFRSRSHFRPGNRRRRGLAAGNSGAIISQSSSSRSAFAMGRPRDSIPAQDSSNEGSFC